MIKTKQTELVQSKFHQKKLNLSRMYVLFGVNADSFLTQSFFEFRSDVFLKFVHLNDLDFYTKYIFYSIRYQCCPWDIQMEPFVIEVVYIAFFLFMSFWWTLVFFQSSVPAVCLSIFIWFKGFLYVFWRIFS